MSEPVIKGSQTGTRRPWEQPSLKPLGTVGKVIAGGGGKISTSQADPGDAKKPSGAG